ncbi:MAG: Holliday junction resolvase-like protein [Dehalococcoidales bacterium]|nr:Holliday junction resolvase-like protein [Dehalococcoidales bacterium]
MSTAGIIAIVVVVAVLVIIFSIFIIRAVYEKRLRDELGEARKDAISRSRASLGGKFTEQLVPFFPDFKYDPTEVRFIGSPIDMVVFPGLAQGNPREVVILEIKTGNSQLTSVQRKIRQLIEDGMVRWDEVHRWEEGEE